MTHLYATITKVDGNSCMNELLETTSLSELVSFQPIRPK